MRAQHVEIHLRQVIGCSRESPYSIDVSTFCPGGNMKKAFLSSLLVYVCFAINTFAQVNATVGGTVADATGALIPGVEVTARNVNTGIAASRISNESGNYEFPSLQPGTYTLSASLPGFQSSGYNNVQLSQGQQVRLNFTLQVATVAAAVEVVAEADTILATTAASVGDVLPESQLKSLPVGTRNVLDLVDMVPGLVGDCAERNCSFGGSRTNEINTTRDGLRTSDGRYDNGVYSGIFTSPDLVEAVRVSARRRSMRRPDAAPHKSRCRPAPAQINSTARFSIPTIIPR